MEKFLLAVIVIIAAVVFVTCNQDDDENTDSESRKEVIFSSNIVKVTPTITTRMVGNEWQSGDAIGIYMFEEASTNVVEDMKNIKYTTKTNGESGTFDAGDVTIFFPDNGDKVRFMSYYPHTESIVDETYKVNVFDQTSQSAIDLLYSFHQELKYDKKTPDKKVPLVFDHMLTKINIHVKSGEGLKNSDLDNIEIHFKGFETEADFDLVTGLLSNGTNISDITPVGISPKVDYVVSYEAIIIPTDNPSTAKIVFDLKNGSGTEGEDGYIGSDVFTWNFTQDELVKGTEYTFNVTVKRSGIVVEAKINDWILDEEKPIDAE